MKKATVAERSRSVGVWGRNMIEINGKYYLSFKQMDSLGIAENTLKRASFRGSKKWEFLPNPDDKRSVLVSYECLSLELKTLAMMRFGSSLVPALNASDASENLSFEQLDFTQRRTAEARFRVVHEYEKYVKEHAKSKKKVQIKKDFVESIKIGNILTEEFATLKNISFKTVERWAKDLANANGNIIALAPKKRTKKYALLSEMHQNTLISFLNHANKMTYAQVYRESVKVWQTQGIKVPSQMKCYRYLNAYTSENYASVLFNREGYKALKDGVLAYIDRDPDSIKFGDVWVADGHQMNFHIKVGKKMVRPILVAFMDMATNYIVGFELMVTESTMSVASALRHAMMHVARKVGFKSGGFIPQVIYIDNGKAFKNKYFGKKTDFESDVTAGLYSRLTEFGMKGVVYARPYNAKAKTIERRFQELQDVEKQAITYTGKNAYDKPANKHRNEKWHKANAEKFLQEHGHLTLEGAYILVATYIDELNQMQGNGKYLNGNSPENKLKAQVLEIDVNKRYISEGELVSLLYHTKECRLTRNGVNIAGTWYLNPSEMSQRQRGGYYPVKYDPLYPEAVYIYEPDGAIWCKAQAWTGQNVHAMAQLGSDADMLRLKEAIAASQEQENMVLKAAKNQLRAVPEVTVRTLETQKLKELDEAVNEKDSGVVMFDIAENQYNSNNNDNSDTKVVIW